MPAKFLYPKEMAVERNETTKRKRPLKSKSTIDCCYCCGYSRWAAFFQHILSFWIVSHSPNDQPSCLREREMRLNGKTIIGNWEWNGCVDSLWKASAVPSNMRCDDVFEGKAKLFFPSSLVSALNCSPPAYVHEAAANWLELIREVVSLHFPHSHHSDAVAHLHSNLYRLHHHHHVVQFTQNTEKQRRKTNFLLMLQCPWPSIARWTIAAVSYCMRR